MFYVKEVIANCDKFPTGKNIVRLSFFHLTLLFIFVEVAMRYLLAICTNG